MTWSEYRASRRAAWSQLQHDYEARFGAEDRAFEKKWSEITWSMHIGWFSMAAFLGLIAALAYVTSR